jgi:putative transposase
MPRKPRFYLPNIPVHVVQRGNNRQAIFFDDSDYLKYLEYLKESLEKYECHLHAYVLMTNHVHLLLTPGDKTSLSQMMQTVGRKYVPYINHQYQRSGTLWEGRYKSSLVQDDVYLLSCMRYIELNPVRAGMVTTASDYRWSSYHFNALGQTEALISAHPLYLALGKDEQERNQSYRCLFQIHMADNITKEIRAAWQTGTPLANTRFKDQIEQALKIKVGYAKRGRPKKHT